MIIFKDWNITATPGVIARQYDNDTRRLEMRGDIPSGWEWTVEVRHGDYFDVIILEPMDGGFGIDLTASQLCLSGNYEMQVRGIREDDIRYTNALRVFIPENLAGAPDDEGDAEWPKITSEFKQLEMSAWKAVECAKKVVEDVNTHPPTPGPDGTWLVWDAATESYKPTDIPLPEGNSVWYTEQNLTEAQQAQARKNMGAADEETVRQLSEEKADKKGVIAVVTPQMFGAVADGIADDTDAVQAALDAGGNIYFPAGRYKVTRQLNATKPSVIRMFKQYPSKYQGDYPVASEDNWMGARIETYSTTNGIVIGDSVNLDGFYIRAMAGFGAEAEESPYGGKGIVLQYDGALGYKTYPSSVRLSHIRVDIDARQNEASYATIPECLFDFRPDGTYHYIIEDVILGQMLTRMCDYAFRSDISYNEANWVNNVYIRNMCVDTHCDYGVSVNGGGGWMFEGLTIQAYGYINKETSAENHQDRPGHRALISLNNANTIGFYSCYLWDTAGTQTWPAQYADGGEIVVNGTAVADEIKNSTINISCMGCSPHFDVCETYVHKKLNAPENLNIKNLEMGVTPDEESGGNVLSLTDGTYEQKVLIPAISPSEEQVDLSISNWMEENAMPQKMVGRNKLNPNQNYERAVTDAEKYLDYNMRGYMYINTNTGNLAFPSSDTMWVTHFIKAEYGDIFRFSKGGVAKHGYTLVCFDADLNCLGLYSIRSGSTDSPEAIDHTKPHVAYKGTAYVKIGFDANNSLSYPGDSEAVNQCITINDYDISYEDYNETYEAKMAGLLPSVTEEDNGKVLTVVDGKWVAV